MKALAVLMTAVIGCASGDDPKPATVDAATTDSQPDTFRFDAALADAPTDGVIFPVEDTGSTAICALPSGTTVTVSGTYAGTPESLIDGQLSTVWNSGDYTGWFRLQFPKAIRFDRVRIAGNALPESDETFTLKTDAAPLTSAVRRVTGENTWIPTIEVPAGSYTDLTIDVSMSMSWIALAEVTVFDSTGGCGIP